MKYSVFTATNGDDQSILDAEIALRKTNPKVLAVLYSKELWTFSINEDEPSIPDPKFELKQNPTRTFTASSIYGGENHNPSSLLPLTYVTFLKALKKLLFSNLSSRGELIPFGNSGLLPEQEILQLEPKLVDSGELFLSLSTKSHKLIRLDELSPSDSNIDKEYALYLAPSGIRAYLANSTIEESKTTHPANHTTIVETLFALHSIKIDLETVTWIKVIPNLGHLNALTSQISDYLRPVTNSKYLVWPLELCFAQKADLINSSEKDRLAETFDDPLSLIDDFTNLRATSSQKTPSNIPTTNNTPIAFDSPVAEPTLIKPQQDLRKPTSVTPGTVNETPLTHDSWDDLDDDLFGDGDGVTDADFNFFDDDGDNQLGDQSLEQELEQVLEESNSDLNLENTDSGAELALEDKLSNDSDSKENNFDIPIEEITIPTTPLYTDPGAPEPVQSPKNNPRKKSIFSPLNFNPIIRSNVDNKYANGGKFFVSTPTNENSVPTVPGDSFALTSDEDDDDDDDDEDEDDDEDDEDEDEDELMNNGSDNNKDTDQTMEENTPSWKSTASDNIPFVKDSTVSALETTEPEFKKLRLESSVPQVPSAEIDPSKDGRIPSPGVGGANGSPNCIPFLLRSIPLHSIPSHFYSDSPSISSSEMEPIIEIFLDQIIWDDGALSEVIPKEEVYTNNCPDSVQRAIAQLFPEIHEASLAEISGLSFAERSYKDYHDDNGMQVESPLSSFKNPEYALGSHGQTTDNMDFTIAPPLPKVSDEEKSDYEFKSFYQIPPPRLTVKRLNQEISIDASALFLWNLMSFTSLKAQKDLRVLFLSPENLLDQAGYFLNDVIEIYEKCQLGHVEPLSFGSTKKGIVGVDYHPESFEDKASSVARSLNESLVKGSNYKDIVILLIDFEQDLKSVIKLSKVFEKMKAAILALPNDRSLPINLILKIISSNHITNGGAFSILSINKLTKFGLSLYNSVGDKNETFASLSSPLPSKISFQLTKQPVAGKLLCEDSFVHLAYGRSIDKQWCVASWTDQLGKIRKTKAWHCSSKVKNSLETVTNEMWDLTVQLSHSLPGRRYLVLTRIDGMIPDDELLQWKRLSSKSRELSLVVVSVNENSKLLLTLENPQFPLDKLFDQEKTFANNVGSTKLEAPNTVGSSTGLTPSTIFTPQAINSPDLFTISKPNVHDSPSEFRVNPDDSNTITNIADKVHALILKNPSPLANSPTRLSIKTGFLIKPIQNSKNKLATFEVNVLSCPGNLPCEELINIILSQYRSLATIGALFGVVDCKNSLIPWHIAAVCKSLSCLVHVHVE